MVLTDEAAKVSAESLIWSDVLALCCQVLQFPIHSIIQLSIDCSSSQAFRRHSSKYIEKQQWLRKSFRLVSVVCLNSYVQTELRIVQNCLALFNSRLRELTGHRCLR